MKFFVIAGNHEQARRWIRQECDRRWASGDTAVTLSDYIYVDDVSRIKGYSNPHGKFIGTWKDRWDIREIIADLSLFYNVQPGAQIYTGTPEGVGAVEPGDLISGEVAGVASVSLTVGPPR